MSIKYKHLTLVFCSLVLMASTVATVLYAQPAHADPHASCDAASGAIFHADDPATGNPSYCSCPAGKTLITGQTNTCQDAAAAAKSCAGGSSGTDSLGVTYCNKVLCGDGSIPANNDINKCGVDAAATSGNCSDTTLKQCDLVATYINPLINFLSALVGVAVTIAIIIGAIQYGSSAGDPQKAAAAKDHITKAVIALLTFLFLYALLNFLVPGGIYPK